jgi:predicted GNAT family N-acyltransferase
MISAQVCQDSDEREKALGVRRAVFVEEQGVPATLEYDALDESAHHFLLTDGEQAVGAARLVVLGPGMGKIGRVAVLFERRGAGLGNILMDTVEAHGKSLGLTTLILHAQTPVVGFYEKRGYVCEGSEFFEADITHVKMSKSL